MRHTVVTATLKLKIILMKPKMIYDTHIKLQITNIRTLMICVVFSEFCFTTVLNENALWYINSVNT